MSKYLSYAQNFEDVYLRRTYNILLSTIPSDHPDLYQFIVDIGAWEPVADSVSASFIEASWNALLIEPQPNYYEKLCNYYISNNKVKVLNFAIGDFAGVTTLFVPAETTGWASNKKLHAEQMNEPIEEISVNICTLDEIHLQIKQNYFVLKIDAENSEYEIINGWRTPNISPTCICLEGGSRVLFDLLKTKGYVQYFFDGINTYFIKLEYYPKLMNFNPINLLEDNSFVLHSASWIINNEFKLKS
jgi:FkbM family methyltransferase